MTSRASGPFAGSVRWAVVPHVPRPPFRLYAGPERAPIEVTDVETVIAAARKGEAALTYLVESKARPVLILNDPPGQGFEEVTALRLVRFSRLTPDERERIRRQEEPLLFHLDPERFDLPDENAAIVPSLVRVHVDAIDAGQPVGVLDVNELRVLGERIIEFYGFDTRNLLERTIQELAGRRRAGSTG